MAGEIRIGGNVGRRIPRAYVTERLSLVLDRLPLAPVTAHVTFSDVNGPKGGADIRCAVLVDLPHQPAIRVEQTATTPRLAFDQSYDRVVRKLERSRERWQENRRHPKKYYAAKRLQ
jgi:ribosome-associated translation inhibitor RaiA